MLRQRAEQLQFNIVGVIRPKKSLMKETAYLLQAALICIWWVGLATNRAFFARFQYDEIPPVAFWAFVAPDVILIAALSAVRAYRKLCMLDYVILGAFGYVALYCLNATFFQAAATCPLR